MSQYKIEFIPPPEIKKLMKIIEAESKKKADAEKNDSKKAAE